MADWPASLQQIPNRPGFQQQVDDSVLRTQMGYGPDKLRQRTTADMETMRFTIWATFDEVVTLRAFYKTNKALEWNWNDFLTNPPTPAIYRFVSPPRYIPLGGLWWQVRMVLETQSP